MLAPAWSEAQTSLPRAATSRITRLLQEPEWRSARVGICFGRLDGATLFAYEAHKLFVPASNTKLLTSALALRRLGADFRFRTELRHEGELDAAGVLQGNLYLVGGGDPSLRRADLRTLAEVAQRAGLRQVMGEIVADSSRVTDGPYGFGWEIDDLPYYYLPEVRALSVDRNAVTLLVTPSMTAGEPALVTVDPPTDYLRIENRVRVTASGARSVEFQRIAHEHAFVVSGQIPAGAESVRQRVSIPDPPRFAAQVLRQELRRLNIAAGEIAVGNAPPTARMLGVVESAPLAELMKELNKTSDNLYAELCLRAVGAKVKGNASAAAGLAALNEWIAELKLPRDQVRLVDGSGLSRHNLVSPEAIVRLLQAMGRGPQREAFVQSLAVMGEDGTLRSRMRYQAAHQAVQAKTGTLSGVSTLSGYVTVSGRPYVFSLMVNQASSATGARTLQERVLLLLMESVRK